MREELEKLLERSKSTYFNYPVSCILEINDGKKFYGVNIETASPASGICAERNAIFSAISNGYTKDDFKALHLMAKSNKELYPCFVCRQALVELCSLDLPIKVYYLEGEKTVTVRDLTPYSFSSEDLK